MVNAVMLVVCIFNVVVFVGCRFNMVFNMCVFRFWCCSDCLVVICVICVSFVT